MRPLELVSDPGFIQLLKSSSVDMLLHVEATLQAQLYLICALRVKLVQSIDASHYLTSFGYAAGSSMED